MNIQALEDAIRNMGSDPTPKGKVPRDAVTARASKMRDEILGQRTEGREEHERKATLLTFRVNLAKEGKTPESLGLLLAYRDQVLMEGASRAGLTEEEIHILVTNQQLCSLEGKEEPFGRKVDVNNGVFKAVMGQHLKELEDKTINLKNVKRQIQAALDLNNMEAAAAHWTAYRDLLMAELFEEDRLTLEEGLMIFRLMSEIC